MTEGLFEQIVTMLNLLTTVINKVMGGFIRW
jgi:hypothetical protein